jgi:hypothetical protein
MIIMTTRSMYSTPGAGPYSGTVGPVTQYTVRAVSERNAVMTFGLLAENYGQAVITASDRLPWHPKQLTVQPLLPPPGRGSATYAEHQKHSGSHDGCRFCV